jgi:uncharacterized protein YbbC (DUF1343 family)
VKDIRLKPVLIITVYLLQGKKIAVVTNQSGVVLIEDNKEKNLQMQTHLVDFLLAQKISILKIFAPEHGFRGTADAGEHIVDGMDSGLPLFRFMVVIKNVSQLKELTSWF